MNCKCLICNIGKLNLNEKHSFKYNQKESKDTCSSSTQEPHSHNKLNSGKEGLSHFCTAGTRHHNLQAFFSNDPVGAEKIAPSVIASKQESPHGTIRLPSAAISKQLAEIPESYVKAVCLKFRPRIEAVIAAYIGD